MLAFSGHLSLELAATQFILEPSVKDDSAIQIFRTKVNPSLQWVRGQARAHGVITQESFQRRLVKSPPSTNVKFNFLIFFKRGKKTSYIFSELLVLATKTPIYISTCHRLDRLLTMKTMKTCKFSVHKILSMIHTVYWWGPNTTSCSPTYFLQSFNRMETSSNLQ